MAKTSLADLSFSLFTLRIH